MADSWTTAANGFGCCSRMRPRPPGKRHGAAPGLRDRAARAHFARAYCPATGMSLLKVSTEIFHSSPTFLKIVTYLPTSATGCPPGPVMLIW